MKTGKTSSTKGTGDIVCPFFRSHSAVQINCEGIMDETTTAIAFRRAERKRFFQRTYCERECGMCEIHRMLMREKYSDE